MAEVEPGEVVFDGKGGVTIGAPVMKVVGTSQTKPGQLPQTVLAEQEEPAEAAEKE